MLHERECIGLRRIIGKALHEKLHYSSFTSHDCKLVVFTNRNWLECNFKVKTLCREFVGNIQGQRICAEETRES